MGAGSERQTGTATAPKRDRERRPPRPIAATSATVAPPDFPPEFDAAHYRLIHADLRSFSLDEVREHYLTRGRREGRQSNVLASREAFRDLAVGLGSILEIGPFSRPLYSGPAVTYFDVLDREGLAALAKKIGLDDRGQIPEIDYVSPTGDLAVVPHTFDVVASSHVIEHQPDLVHHLRQVERVLKPGGYYFLWIPDKRYCLDHFQAESTIAAVIEAAAERRRFHTLSTLIAQEVLRAHNDPRRHWLGDHGTLPEHPAPIVRAARALYDESRARGEYVDRHAWQFTPASFRAIVGLLNELEMAALRPLRVYDTLFPHNEFWAILQKP